MREQRLERKLNEPTLSILAWSRAAGCGAPAARRFPPTAAARLEMRLVNGLVPAKQNALVVAHIRKQGYFVVDGRDPTDEERRTHAADRARRSRGRLDRARACRWTTRWRRPWSPR